MYNVKKNVILLDKNKKKIYYLKPYSNEENWWKNNYLVIKLLYNVII